MKKGKVTGISAIILGLLASGIYFGESKLNIDIPFGEEIVSVINNTLGLENNKVSTNNSTSNSSTKNNGGSSVSTDSNILKVEELPKWDGTAKGIVVTVNNNDPEVSKKEMGDTSKGWVKFSELDNVKGKYDKTGRAHTATAMLTKENMPTEERGNISSVTPTGWNTEVNGKVKGWNSVIGYVMLPNDAGTKMGKHMPYDRSHLIGYQLSSLNGKGLNAIPENLITGARYLNAPGMLNFENQVAEYLKTTDNYVYYQVSPIYNKNEPLARGVQMRAQSIDKGKEDDDDLEFNVFIHNENPGYEVNFNTGEMTKTN